MQQAARGHGQRETRTDLVFGTVTSVSPLTIQIDDKFPVYESQIVLSALCKPFVTDIYRHLHADNYYGNTDERLQTVTVWRGLQAGDRVRMLQCNGGQKYFVLDREVFP
jgi:hypothetical protein